MEDLLWTRKHTYAVFFIIVLYILVTTPHGYTSGTHVSRVEIGYPYPWLDRSLNTDPDLVGAHYSMDALSLVVDVILSLVIAIMLAEVYYLAARMF